MPLTNNGKETMLNAFIGEAEEVSLHSSDPGAGGSNEVTGGGYSRQAISASDWTGPTDGEVLTVADIQFFGPEGQEVTHAGFWGGAGQFLGWGPTAGSTSFDSNGEFVLRTGTKAHLNN